ncbi:MAG: AIPR family protein [Cyanobacteria bacterium P01_F01_bin.150]
MAPSNDTQKFAVKQLQGEIKRLFGEDLIDLTDLEGSRVDKATAFLSRGFAAYTLYALAGIGANEAAESIVDGQGDNGIDAIFWHKNDNVLWFIQSKWIKKGTGQPEYKDINNFATGVRNLIEDNLDRPNSRLCQKKEETECALSTFGVKVNIVITHTGQGLTKTSRKCLEDLVGDLNTNEDDEIFSYQLFDKDIAYKTAVENANKLNIEANINLSNWGKMDDPTAFYGSISALELAELWIKHRNNLFSQNLREFIGQTKANDDITRTLKEDPTSFWYFNNGITALCQEIRRKTKGVKRLNDDFTCKGLSIINGAQTIGSIGRYYREGTDEARENLEQTEVLIKLISLEDCPENFGLDITKASNTQNHVENRDFLALDPIQRKLARELKTWDRNKTYFYKRSDEMISSENSCTLLEATEALVCNNDDLNLVVILKKDVSEFWADTSSSLYKRIFNAGVSPLNLWRSIEVYRSVKKHLQDRSNESKLVNKITIHGNFFLTHLVFHDINQGSINIFQDDIKHEDYELFLPQIIECKLDAVHNQLKRLPSSTRLGIFFKNNKKCTDLKSKIIGK